MIRIRADVNHLFSKKVGISVPIKVCRDKPIYETV